MKFRPALIKTHLAVSLIPWATLAYFVLYGFSARLFIGHWPQYWEPALDWSPLLGACGEPVRKVLWSGSQIVSVLLVLSVPVWMVLFGVRLQTQSGPHLSRAFLVFLWGWVTVLYAACFDPTGFVVWLWDAKWPN